MQLCRSLGSPGLIRDQRGITGLETAIALIAFVVVASVFAFAVLSTGLLSAEKSKEAALGGLEEASSTVTIRGDVIGDSDSTLSVIGNVKFQLSSSGQAAEAVDLSDSGTLISYLDDNQSVNIASTLWSAVWLIGSGPLLDPNEAVEMDITLTGLTNHLSTSTEFTTQVKPNKGAVVVINRTTPPEFKAFMNLQ